MLKSYLKYLYGDVVKDYRKYFYEFIEEDKDAFVLDCGCWDGKNTLKYGKKAGTKNLYGIELEKNKAEIAGKKGINTQASDLNSKFPFPNNFFDVVLANHVIEHLSNPAFFVNEIHRVLKKGGYAVIGTPNLASWHNIFALFLGIQPFSGPHAKVADSEMKAVREVYKERFEKIFEDKFDSLRHLVIMTYKSLVRLFKDSGFILEKSQCFGYYPFPPFIAKLLQRIDKTHTHYVVIKVRKK